MIKIYLRTTKEVFKVGEIGIHSTPAGIRDIDSAIESAIKDNFPAIYFYVDDPRIKSGIYKTVADFESDNVSLVFVRDSEYFDRIKKGLQEINKIAKVLRKQNITKIDFSKPKRPHDHFADKNISDRIKLDRKTNNDRVLASYNLNNKGA